MKSIRNIEYFFPPDDDLYLKDEKEIFLAEFMLIAKAGCFPCHDGAPMVDTMRQ